MQLLHAGTQIMPTKAASKGSRKLLGDDSDISCERGVNTSAKKINVKVPDDSYVGGLLQIAHCTLNICSRRCC